MSGNQEQFVEQKQQTEDSAPNDKDQDKKDGPLLSPETQKILEKSQLLQAEIQGNQLESVKAVYDLIKKLDEEKVKEIEEQFGKGFITLQEIDEDGNTKPFTKPYIPLTTRAEEAVNKIIREVKTFRADVTAKLPLEDLQRKYPELAGDLQSLEEIAPDITTVRRTDSKGAYVRDKSGKILTDKVENDSEAFLNLIDNYVTKRKCKIYFKIDDIGNFSRKDLRALIFLYQYRNNYNPYYVSPT